jgi:hypothetical protein
VRLTHRIVGLISGRQDRAGARATGAVPDARDAAPNAAGAVPDAAGTVPDAAGAVPDAAGVVPDPLGAEPGGPGAATAAALAADPCGPARVAAEDACSLADRMNALAVASHDRLREARRAYDEHVGRRQRAAEAADPRAVRAAKDEAQAAFRRARLAATDRGALEVAAGEWLREVDRINARTREAVRIVEREDAAEIAMLQAMDRLGIEADGARIAAESAAEACRNARIALATCEERERVGVAQAAHPGAGVATLAPASVAARIGASPPVPVPGAPLAAARSGDDDAGRQAGDEAPAAGEPGAVEPAILPLLAGDRAVLQRLAVDVADGDPAAARQWEVRLADFVEAVRARAIDSAALGFPEDHVFWGPYTQVQCREISAALAALGFRFDGHGGFVDGRVPGQRELSLAIGYAGLDPMRVRIWPSEAELPVLYADVQVDAARFVAETAGELTLGEMIDMLGRRAEDMGELWNAWGRVRPLLLGPA